MEKLVLELEKVIFETKRIQETIGLLDSVAQRGWDSLDNYTQAINLMSNLARENCKKLNALFEELHILTKNNKTSKGGDAT